LTQLVDALLAHSFDFRSAIVQANGIEALVARHALVDEEAAKDKTLQRVMLFAQVARHYSNPEYTHGAQDGFGRSMLLKCGALELVLARYSLCLSTAGDRDETVMLAAVTVCLEQVP